MPLYIRVALLLCCSLPQAATLQEVNWVEEERKFQEHLQLWRSQNLTQYNYLAESNCFGCFWYFPAIVSVSNGDVVAILEPDTGAPMLGKTIEGETRAIVPEDPAYLTIEDIFEKIDDAIRKHEGTVPAGTRMAESLIVEYDETYGYPASLSIGYGFGRGVLARENDSGVSMKVSNLTP